MKRIARSTLQTAVNLAFFAVIGTAILAATFSLTHEAIENTIEAEKLKLISQIVPPSQYDNDILRDVKNVPADALLGTSAPTIAYIARLKEQPAAAIIEVVAREGYSGDIRLILAIRPNGELSGVRVLAHKETPGLGDYIDIGKSDWIKGFDGKSRITWGDAQWKVKKDGGQFDYMAGATITPRAVVKEVNQTLQYFALHRDELFAPTTVSAITTVTGDSK
ncbi:MAG: electron transport complex subunit RsxG [Sideroxydans sp.]|nr:electron transport complex subunit RsxG [Sideroxydans sp.]